MTLTPPAAELLNRYVTALARNDVDAIVALFADDIVLDTPCIPEPAPRQIAGRDQIAPVFQWTFSKVFKVFAWDEIEVHASDDPQLAFAVGKANVELHDGRNYRNDVAIHVRARDGRIVKLCEFFDTTRAAKAFEGQG